MAQIPHTLIKGQRFYADYLMTNIKTEAKDELAQRTWKERLLTWPWRPWVATKPVVRYYSTEVPSRQVIRYNDCYFAHPDLIAEIVAQTKKEEQ